MHLERQQPRVLADALQVETSLGIPVFGQPGKGADGGVLRPLEGLRAGDDAVVEQLLDLQ
jgi:hypothetical protein